MEVMLVLIPIALLFAGAFVAAFFWAVEGGQLDDLDTPPHRVLLDDDAPQRPASGETSSAPESTGSTSASPSSHRRAKASPKIRTIA